MQLSYFGRCCCLSKAKLSKLCSFDNFAGYNMAGGRLGRKQNCGNSRLLDELSIRTTMTSTTTTTTIARTAAARVNKRDTRAHIRSCLLTTFTSAQDYVCIASYMTPVSAMVIEPSIAMRRSSKPVFRLERLSRETGPFGSCSFCR